MTVIGVLLRRLMEVRVGNMALISGLLGPTYVGQHNIVHYKIDMSVETSFHPYPALLLQQLSFAPLFLERLQPPFVDAFRPLVAKPRAREVQAHHLSSRYPNHNLG